MFGILCAGLSTEENGSIEYIKKQTYINILEMNI